MGGEGFIYAFAAGLLPSLVWLFFWTREDSDQPEPRTLLFACFLSGMAVVFAAIPIEQYLATMAADATTKYIYWAAAEEILKLFAVSIIALHHKANDEPVDSMVYIITVALGFAALENALFIMGPLSGGNIAVSLITGNMRFIGATLVHVVSSALIGFGLGLTFYRGFGARFLTGLVCLGGAIALHAAFNIAISGADAMDTLRTFGWVWGAVVLLIVLFEEVKVVRQRTV